MSTQKDKPLKQMAALSRRLRKLAVQEKEQKQAARKHKGFITCKQAITLVKQGFSYAVKFTRKAAITERSDGHGGWVEVENPGSRVLTSSRRFGTAREATIHGRRFMKLEGHRKFTVVKTKDKPNAWVNLKTGKTNPLVGRKRLR